MNVFTFSGNLGNDCRTGNTGGTAVVNFSVACKSGYGDNAQTNWIDCALWGKRGESLQQYLTKGQRVIVSGELGTREHDGKTYITCRVNDVTLAGDKQQASGQSSNGQAHKPQQQRPAQQSQASQSSNQQRQAPMEPPIDFDQEIPF